MASTKRGRRLIVNADDFGRSSPINQAVIRAHREGILTTASLMVTGAAAAEAIELARENSDLGVGLHLTLLCGRSVLPANRIPGLVGRNQSFSERAVQTGFRYFFLPSLIPQLQQEIAAQLEAFSKTGLVLDHVNGHLNLHLHPTIFRILTQSSAPPGIRALRLTREPWQIDIRLGHGRWLYRASHALIFALLTRWAEPQLRARQISYTPAVFGLLETGRVDEDYLLQLLPRLPAGDSELYSHPCLENSRGEFDALVSPRVQQLARDTQIQLIRYQDL